MSHVIDEIQLTEQKKLKKRQLSKVDHDNMLLVP